MTITARPSAATQFHEATTATGTRRRLALGLLVSAQFVVMLDTSIVNVALPTIQADLGLGPSAITWVVNAYVLAFGGLLLLSGQAADLLGRRRTFVAGSALFTLGTLLAVVAMLALPLVLNVVPTVVLITELFPRRIRASGLSVVYCIGVLVFGGFAQLIATWLIALTGNASAPALYVIGCGVISLAGLAMVPETAGRRLD